MYGLYSRAAYDGARTVLLCSVSVPGRFALVAFGDSKISINYRWSGASPIKQEIRKFLGKSRETEVGNQSARFNDQFHATFAT